ncbi:MAG: lecithin retinol acyltransferase family protein [Oscillospiraceae bacterium]|nr:lecithin retinol acyltransferase family protein [Oscillospiraceae bacterium]
MQYLYSGEESLLELLAEHLKADDLGDMPNIETKTLGGEVWWDTLMNVNGWKLQVHKIGGNARILDPNNIRKAWGSRSAMEEKLKRMTSEAFLQPGDVIGVKRGIYEHYAIYIGDDKVIHYAAENGDFEGSAVTVHEAPMSEFLRGNSSFFFINFPDKNGKFEKIYTNGGDAVFSRVGDSGELQQILTGCPDYHLYTPEETVERAKSRLGESKYDLAVNNCEHFAFWCKTGLSDSHQVNNVINGIANARTALSVLSDILNIVPNA